jgi:pyruvate/2-oxoglutarate dehydrogenase complex dihydrolipoamide acyltransferase (E2) component
VAVAINLPDMGTNVEECRVQTWLVQEGQPVKRGMVLAEIETDKAVAELESTAEGVLLRQVVKAGEAAQTGDVLAYVGQPGEAIPEATPAAEPQAAPPAMKAVTLPASTKAPGVVQRTAPVSPIIESAVRISPVVRNLAGKLGVDLTKVQGTGAGGVITREDVLRASKS